MHCLASTHIEYAINVAYFLCCVTHDVLSLPQCKRPVGVRMRKSCVLFWRCRSVSLSVRFSACDVSLCVCFTAVTFLSCVSDCLTCTSFCRLRVCFTAHLAFPYLFVLVTLTFKLLSFRRVPDIPSALCLCSQCI